MTPFVGAVSAAAALIIGGFSGAASADVGPPEPISLPAPTGPYAVGTTTAPIAGPNSRELMVQVWYPARKVGSTPARYMPPQTTLLAAQQFHVAPGMINAIDTHAFTDSAPAPHAHPVVLFSPGENGLRSDSTALETELASRGYVVVGIDIPGESALVEYPDGRVIPGTFVDTGDPSRASQVRVRLADIRTVLNSLGRMNQHGTLRARLDLSRIGMFGFSLGGATAAAAIRKFPQIRAGANLDGSVYDQAVTTPSKKAFLFLGRDDHSNASDPSWRTSWSLLHGFRREIRVVGAGHEDFGDNAGFADALGLDSQFTPEEIGTIAPARATNAIRQVLVAFFDRSLRGKTDAMQILDAPASVNPELARLQ